MKKKLTRDVNIELSRFGFRLFDYEFEYSTNYFEELPDYARLSIVAEPTDDFNKLINDKDKIVEAINRCKNEEFDYNVLTDDEIENAEFYKTDFDNDHKNIKMNYSKFFSGNYDIYLIGNKEQVTEFLNNNPSVYQKKIIIKNEGYEQISINDSEYVDYLVNNLENLSNVFLDSEGNENDVSIELYKNTIDIIDNISSRINSLNLSPMEKAMYAYDIVRDRKYKFENKKDNARTSRDLSQVLAGDKIVCVGYAEIYDKILKKLGIVSKIQYLRPVSNIGPGHQRNIAYIKDDKYDIDGVYFFDTTWDSKTNKTDNHFNSYRFFARTMKTMNKLDLGSKNRVASKEYYLYGIKNKLNNCPDEINSEDIIIIGTLSNQIFRDFTMGPMFMMNCNSTSSKGNKDCLDMSVIDIFKERFGSFINKFENELTREQFIKLLINVRAAEYYQNPKKFPLSAKKIEYILKKNGICELTSEEKVLACIFGERKISPKRIIKEEGLDKKIEGVRLAKALRLTLEKKQNEEDTQ